MPARRRRQREKTGMGRRVIKQDYRPNRSQGVRGGGRKNQKKKENSNNSAARLTSYGRLEREKGLGNELTGGWGNI